MSCDIAGSYLIFVRSERCQDFTLFLFRDLDEVQSASEFCCDFIEFRRGDFQAPVGLL